MRDGARQAAVAAGSQGSSDERREPSEQRVVQTAQQGNRFSLLSAPNDLEPAMPSLPFREVEVVNNPAPRVPGWPTEPIRNYAVILTGQPVRSLSLQSPVQAVTTAGLHTVSRAQAPALTVTQPVTQMPLRPPAHSVAPIIRPVLPMSSTLSTPMLS